MFKRFYTFIYSYVLPNAKNTVENQMDIVETSSDESSTEGKRFVCNIAGCVKKFSKNRKLQNHLRLHKGERPFVCDIQDCGKSYTNSSHLLRHKRSKHAETIHKIKCTEAGCNKELAAASLKKHIYRWHNPSRVYPFMCNICPQGFQKKKQLHEHTYLHTGELPFSCDHCPVKFKSIRDKNRHNRSHKKYICECDTVCEKWTAFRAHRKVCKLLAFRCAICEKVFSNRQNLRLHINVHMDMEDREIYVCPYDECESYFFYKTSLNTHMNNIHKKIPKSKIPCTYEGCNKLLCKMQNYKIHLKTHEENFKPKFPRKPRKDKGIIKKKIIEDLSGIKASDVIELEDKKNAIMNNQTPDVNCDSITSSAVINI